MSNGYKVDLSALDEAIKKLNVLVDDMSGPKSKAKYETNIPTHWLGKDFSEAVDLSIAHDTTKMRIEKYLDRLQELVIKHSSNTSQVRRNYDDQEQRTQQEMSNHPDLS
jgi:hypothetical protein